MRVLSVNAPFTRACPSGIAQRSHPKQALRRSEFVGTSLPVSARRDCRRTSESPQVVQALFGGKNNDKMTVAITDHAWTSSCTRCQCLPSGATGLVGSRLVAKLASEGHTVKVLTRNVSKARGKLPYANVEFVAPSDWEVAIAGCYGVVNLAGEPIATRWDDRVKQEIKRSRVDTTTRLANAINGLSGGDKPKVFVSSSAVGYYGTSNSATFKEDSPAGGDYLAEICREWEAAAGQAKGTRNVIIRTGIVLAKEGGALAKMIPVFQVFSGGPLGSGSQWMSWVHRDDLVGIIMEALKNSSFKGVYNGTAPNPVRMSQLCSTLGSAMGRPSWLPVPDFALQGLLGEGATVVLEGQKVVPTKTQKSGYKFKYSTIDEAISDLVQ